MFANSLTPNEGVLIIIWFAAVMITLTLLITRNREKTKREFLLANRSIGLIAGAMSIGASWIWAPAMFVSSQKTYEQGVAGLFWYIVPNIGTLIIFGPFAAKLRSLLPDGYTLPQYMRIRHGRRVQILYLFQFFTLQLCAIGAQILAASHLLTITTGMSYPLAGLMIVCVPLTYAIIGGLRASVATDYLQMIAMLFICSVTVPWAISKAGGYSTIIAGLGGVTGRYTNPLDPWVFYSFGISITIGLLSGPLGDQMQWQRAYALKQNGRIRLTFFLGAIIFGSVPLTLCNLGFLAANKSLSASWHVVPQMVGPITVANLLPHYMTVAFVVMVLMGLCSTIDSSLCAVASLVTTDICSFTEDDNQADSSRVIARVAMIIAALLGYCVAQIPDLQILHLFLFYGTMRASTMVPTIFTLICKRLNPSVVFVTILASLILGGPLLVIGNVINNIHLSVLGSVLVVVIGVAGCNLGLRRS
jgi:Na+/proline symporter